MTIIWDNIVYGFHKLFEENNDPRTKNLLFVSSSYPIIIIMTSYLAFSTYIGPRLMRNRKPFELTNILTVYNAFQVLLSLYILVEGFFGGWYRDYSYFCQPVDYSDNPVARRMNNAAWWYLFGKITELLDTVFFILRKKNNQVTFLHVYHHFIMPIFSYMGVRWYPNGHGTMFGILNCLVHVVMYTYYLIAGLGPQYQKYLWWKKHVTSIQLIQFVLIFIHNFPPLFTNCKYPKGLNILLCCEAVIFIYLFGKFYIKNYIKTQKKSDLNGNAIIKENGIKNQKNGTTNGKLKIRQD